MPLEPFAAVVRATTDKSTRFRQLASTLVLKRRKNKIVRDRRPL